MVWFLKKKEDRRPESAPSPSAPRVRVLSLAGVAAELDSAPGRRLELSNISSSGVAFIVEEGLPPPERGVAMQGQFHFGESRIPFAGEVVHSTGQVIGLRFTGATAAISEMVQKHFDIELRAKAMVEVKREMLKEEPDGKPRWFRSSRGFDLFLVEGQGGEVVSFHLAFLGHYFEGARGKALRYGNVVDAHPGASAQYKGSDVIQFQNEIPADTRSAAVRVVENVNGLGEDLLRYFRDQFSLR
jgi:hypothetical protein